MHKESLKREERKRKSNMNNTFSNGKHFKIEEIVGKRIFTEANL
jgi:hypothetical protein